MLLDRSQRLWALFTAVATLLAIFFYVAVFHPERIPGLARLPAWLGRSSPIHASVGNSPLGLTYGIISFLIFLFAALLPLRRKFPLLPLGRIQHWLRGHIWLTILTLPLVFLHAAFRFGGFHTSALMWLYLAVMLSGFYGLALQQFIPRLMQDRLPLETIFEQIPYLRLRLAAAAGRIHEMLRPSTAPVTAGGGGIGTVTRAGVMVAAAPPTDESVEILRTAITDTILPFLADGASPAEAAEATEQFDAQRGRHYNVKPFDQAAAATVRRAAQHAHQAHDDAFRLEEPNFAADFFRRLRLSVKPELADKVLALENMCAERRQMDQQVKYQRLLHSWILFHAPASFLLVAWTLWHAIALVFFY